MSLRQGTIEVIKHQSIKSINALHLQLADQTRSCNIRAKQHNLECDFIKCGTTVFEIGKRKIMMT